MSSMFFGKLMDWRDVQPLKAASPIRFILLGIKID